MAEKFVVDVTQIVAGCSTESRAGLLALLTELVTTLDNLDAICPVTSPPCHTYLRFNTIRRLYAALSAQADEDRALESRKKGNPD